MVTGLSLSSTSCSTFTSDLVAASYPVHSAVHSKFNFGGGNRDKQQKSEWRWGLGGYEARLVCYKTEQFSNRRPFGLMKYLSASDIGLLMSNSIGQLQGSAGVVPVLGKLATVLCLQGSMTSSPN